MSLMQTVEVVCDLNETRVLRLVLEESDIVYTGKVVLVDGQSTTDLNMLVHRDSNIVIMSPVVGG
ncbi:MAG: hypothetical protein KAR39_02795 [Thermoplasmata archaeon]|nr:hypothetical protein [Thermoplasmata archaeon]